MTVIQIEKTTKASEIMAAFSNQFPYLKIEFFKKLITFERSLKKNFIKDDFIIKTEKNIKFITFEEATLVSELKNQFYKNFNLSVQIMRKSGQSWIETSFTDSWSLKKQNQEAFELSEF
jgi:hypothetical protein